MHHSDVDNVVDFCFYQVGTNTYKVPMLNPTTSVVDENYEATTSVVADNRMKTVMMFADILRGNQSPKSAGGGLTLSYLPRRRICPRRSRSYGSHFCGGRCF